MTSRARLTLSHRATCNQPLKSLGKSWHFHFLLASSRAGVRRRGPAWLSILGLAALLGACGGPREMRVPTPAATPAVSRFADDDPQEWRGPAPWHYPVHGIDVSRYQGEIDWARVRGAGVSFAYIKATEGADVLDAMFTRNWEAARQAGVPRGAYHFYYFCRSAAEQAAWFTRHVPRDAASLPPVLDMEWNHRSRTCPLRPDPVGIRREMGVFLDTLTRHFGRRPVIYSTVDFYHDNELWRIAGYDFWLRAVADHPTAVYPSRPWTFWQYTGTGLVDGIVGRTDLNVFAGSHAQWRSWAAGRG